MSQEKNHSNNMDMTGRVLSLEQRVKGLRGRIAAIEAGLSANGGGAIPGNIPSEDFVPARSHLDHPVAGDYDMPDGQNFSPGQVSRSSLTVASEAVKPGFDRTGLIAGGILIGAGILLLTGNVEVIKNPLVVMGCGILLVASAFKRKSYK